LHQSEDRDKEREQQEAEGRMQFFEAMCKKGMLEEATVDLGNGLEPTLLKCPETQRLKDAQASCCHVLPNVMTLADPVSVAHLALLFDCSSIPVQKAKLSAATASAKTIHSEDKYGIMLADKLPLIAASWAKSSESLAGVLMIAKEAMHCPRQHEQRPQF